MTWTTVGYGDIYPFSDLGQILILCIILIIVVVRIPQQVGELIRLMGLKSPYERDSYKPNPEIPFIVIAGDVVLTALNNISSEFYHPDHG